VNDPSSATTEATAVSNNRLLRVHGHTEGRIRDEPHHVSIYSDYLSARGRLRRSVEHR
jgi:hypothetical protein